MTGAFDASSGLFLIYRLVYESWGGPKIQTFFRVYCILPACIFVAQLWYMPGKIATDDMYHTAEQTDSPISSIRRSSTAIETTNLIITAESFSRAATQLADPDLVTGVMHTASVSTILSSGWFLLPAAVMITSLIRVNFWIATINAQLIFLLGSQDADTAMNIFDVLLPLGGILAIPLIGWILDTYTTPTVYLLTLILSMVSGALSFVPNKYAQILHILSFVVLRPWIYSILPGTVTKLFGLERFGAFYGLIMAVAGLVNLLAHDLDILTWRKYHGNFYPVDAGLVILSCSSLILTFLYMTMKVRRMKMD